MAPRGVRPGPGRSDAVRQLEAHCGLAVLAVMVFHVYQFCDTDRALSAGTPAHRVLDSLDAAVSWLIVIVTFLVFEPIVRAVVDRVPPVAARQVARAAAVRVLPVYYVVVVVVWLSRQTVLPGDWRDLVEHLTFTQVFDNTRIFWTVGPAWALSATIWSVLASLGLLLLVARCMPSSVSRRQRVGVVACCVVLLVATSSAWKAWAFAAIGGPTQGSFAVWFGPLAVLDNVALGLGVALTVVALRPSGPLGGRGRAGLRAVAAVTLVLAVASHEPDSWTTVSFLTVCAAGFGFLTLATALGPRAQLHTSDAPASPSAHVRHWLGAIALSSYLWHEPVMLALQPLGLVRQAPHALARDVVVVVAASLLVGWISYVTIERPVRRLATAFDGW